MVLKSRPVVTMAGVSRYFFGTCLSCFFDNLMLEFLFFFSLASEQLHHHTNRPVRVISYAALFTNILTQQPSKAVRLLMGSARTHSGSRGVKRVIQRAIPSPTPVMPPMPYENCPAAIQDLPLGPLTMFVDGSWKDEGNGIENVFLPPHIPRPFQQRGASIVFMAANPE